MNFTKGDQVRSSVVEPVLTPISVQRKPLNELPPYCDDAVEEANRQMVEPVPYDYMVRLERYRIQDIIHLMENVWKWSSRFTLTMDADDRERIQAIINKIKEGAPAWPYVSYFTDSMDGLMEMEQEDDEDGPSVVNHGDGWHRLVAAVELGLDVVEFLFIESAKPAP